MSELNGIISLLIACLELLLIINILIFSKRRKEDIAGIFLIALLLVYQSFEFIICNLNFTSSLTVYLAFVAITLLSPAGITLVILFYSYKIKYAFLVYIPALFWISYYFFTISNFEVVKCSMLYAAYNYPLGFWYGLTYYAVILLTLIIIVFNIRKTKRPESNKQNYILLTAFLSFTLPMIIAYFLYPLIVEVIESVMCKFAFLFAVLLAYFSLEGRKRNEVT